MKRFAAIFCLFSLSLFAADPELHLRFDEASGTTASDSSGNGFAATLTGGAAFDTAGLFNNALLLDGTDDHAVMDNTATLNFAAGEAFSISVWVRTTDALGTIVGFRSSTDGNAIVGLHVGFNGAVTNSGRILTIVRQSTTGTHGQVIGNTINDGNWHHVVLVRTASQIELFMDGVSQGADTTATALGALTTNLRAVGTELRWVQDNVNSVDQRYLAGRVDELRIYKRALGGAEITALTQQRTTTALTGPSSSVSGSNVTFTATVTTPLGAVNTGSVTFRDGAASLGTVTVNASGVATLSTASLGLGTHSITAEYSGATDLSRSTSSVLTLNVLTSVTPNLHLKLNETSGTVAADSSGNNFNGTYTNGPTFTTGRIAGAIQLDGTDDHVVLDNTATLNFAANEPFTVSAWIRTTDQNGPIVSFRNSANDQSLIDFCVGFNGANNSPGNLVAIVRQDAGGGNGNIAGGAVADNAWHHVALVRTATQIELFRDGVSQGTSTAAQALGAITSNERAVGVELRWVAVNANTADQRYLSGSVDDVRIYKRALTTGELVSLTQPDTTTTLATGATTVFGQSRTLTATVSHATQTVNGGTVTFREGAAVLGTGAVNASGVATLTLATLSVGTHNLVADFSGFSFFGESTSASAAATVNQASTTTSVGATPTPSVFGQSVQFIATVAAVAPGAGTPTGSVQFFDGAISLGTVAMTAGQATFSISSLSVSAHPVTATYLGDTNFTTSTSPVLTHTVNQATTTTTLLSSQNPAPVNTAVTFTAQVTAVAPGSGTATGTVTFSVDGNPQTPVALGAGVATLTLTLPGPSHTIGATYNGSASYAGSSAANLTQLIQIPPVANPQSIVVGQGQSASITLTGSDVNALPLTFALSGAPANGTVSISGATALYTPVVGFTGADAFTFTAFNGQLNSAPATVSITVLPPPAFVSPPQLTSNPVLAGQVVGVTASAGSATLGYDWGDGVSGVGNSHVYTLPGLYTLTVSATDPVTGLVSVQTVTVFVSMGLEGAGSGTGAATPPGITGILVGGSGLGASAGGSGRIVCNYVRRDKTTYSGSLGTLAFPATLTQADLTATSGILRLGVGALAQQFYFELDKNGRGRATDVKQIELSIKKKRFKFKVMRKALTDLTEALGGPREFAAEKRSPVTLFVPATVQVGNKLFLAMTFQVGYQQVNNRGKGALAK